MSLLLLLLACGEAPKKADRADTAEAQKAVELLHGKCFMGHEIAVTGVKTEA